MTSQHGESVTIINIMAKLSDVRVVATSALVSVSDVVLNLIVALMTGSTVMLSQALQGLSDLVTGGLLYVGVRRSKRKADDRFHFGYGRELFFWVLIASIIMFVGTGGMSLYFGWQQLTGPSSIDRIWLALGMLIFGFSTNFYAFRLSFLRMRNEGKKRGRTWWRHFKYSSIVETKATFVIDFLGTSAATLGMVALLLYVATGDARFDGVGSIVIGLTMMIAAFFLMLDIRDLIIGKAVDEKTLADITRAASSVDEVQSVLDLRTMFLGSSKLFVVIEVHLRDHLTTDQVEYVTDEIKRAIRRRVSLVKHVQVEIETPDDEVKSREN